MRRAMARHGVVDVQRPHRPYLEEVGASHLEGVDEAPPVGWRGGGGSVAGYQRAGEDLLRAHACRSRDLPSLSE